MIYNQQRHIQLLKRSQDFKDQGKSFYKESPEESLELRRNLMIASDKFLIQLGAGEVKDFQPDPRSKKLSGF